ncbi:methyltransferase-like protein 25B [Gouania willdenowi]|nr:protein RRNAD1 [Gouania willdenowi]
MWSLSAEQQRDLALKLTTFLSHYSHLSDSYIIEFFSEDLWNSLPTSWQTALQDLTYPQVADLLLDVSHKDRRYPSVWPLSLLAYRATAHALAFPREHQQDGGGSVKPEEFLKNESQSSLLGHIFRKHVKPKKQHEIRKLGVLVKKLCDHTGCDRVVDMGSGQGHLTRFLSFGLGLSVTAIEADHVLVATATKFDGELLQALEKENQKKNSGSLLPVPSSMPHHLACWVNPKASWEAFIQQLQASDCVSEGVLDPSGPSKKRLRGFELKEGLPVHCTRSQDSNKDKHEEVPAETSSQQSVRREGTTNQSHSDFILTGLHACGDLSSTLLRHFINCPYVRGITSVACCYMKITTVENPSPPGLVAPPETASESDPDPALTQFGYPMSSWVHGLVGHQLSYKAREGACHAVEDYVRRLREGSELLKTHCYRAMLETFIRDTRPELRRAGIQTIKKAHLLPFTEYARLGLVRVGLPPDMALDPGRVEAMLKQQGRVVVFFSLALLMSPVVESLVLLDRMIYLQENGVDSQLVPLFNPNFSPRNFVLVALKSRGWSSKQQINP